MTSAPSNSSSTIRNIPALLAKGLVAPDQTEALDRLAKTYAVAVTPDLLDLIDRDDANDPIRKQFIPDLRETITNADEIIDPIGDHAHEKAKGLIHRYEHKALLKIVGTCPIYCRFCFRREMVGPDKGDTLTPQTIEAALAYIASTPSLQEIILTGGDPLILSIPRLRNIAERLGAIAHLQKIRWHTRFPVASPTRVTDAMAQALVASGKETRLALHINHPREFSPAVKTAIAILQKQGIEILSQSVLLAGINHTLETLEQLKACFAETGITPYYLHHPDLAKGTSHFRLPLKTGIALIKAWHAINQRETLPRYVLDLPGGFGKIDLLSDAVKPVKKDLFEITDRKGRVHRYQSAVASSSSAL